MKKILIALFLFLGTVSALAAQFKCYSLKHTRWSAYVTFRDGSSRYIPLVIGEVTPLSDEIVLTGSLNGLPLANSTCTPVGDNINEINYIVVNSLSPELSGISIMIRDFDDYPQRMGGVVGSSGQKMIMSGFLVKN